MQARIDSWLHPWDDPVSGSYQIIQSLLAIANGGIEGRGSGLGSPGLIPVAGSDFIYAVIAEETGQSIERVAKDSDRNYWMDAQQAREYGLVSRVITRTLEIS